MNDNVVNDICRFKRTKPCDLFHKKLFSVKSVKESYNNDIPTKLNYYNRL